VSGSGRGCNELTGRFVVREIEWLNQTVVRFAADFEQHCEDSGPALFGAIRYNSTIADLVPFHDQYPSYELTIIPPDHGRIVGGGIDCGTGATACFLSLSSVATVQLTATPDPGYMFAGWSGDCSGAVTIWLAVNQRRSCSAQFEPGIQGITAFFYDSKPGDPLGQGQQRTLTPLEGTFIAARNFHNGVSVTIRPQNFSFWWNLDFSAAGNTPLAVGSYPAAGDYPFTPMNGISVSGTGYGCNGNGRFIVREVVYEADGSVRRFAADFELHCGDVVPALFGAIRYNSTITDLAPFGGEYPRYQLTITPADHGVVTGDNLNCGAGSLSCQLLLPAAARLTLTATPNPGYVFTGWTTDCYGGPVMSIHVNMPKECTAFFEPLVSSAPRTLMYVDSQQGDFVGSGKKGVLSLANSFWSVTSARDGNTINVQIDDAFDRWRIDFSAPEGQPLTVGYYSAARRYPFTPFNGLSVTGPGSGCNQLTGRFVVLEVAIASNGTVERFAADFEQHCEDQVPAVFGAIRYNATVDEVVPFDGAYPSYDLALTQPINGRVSGGGITCSASASQCSLTLLAAGQVTLTATPDPGYIFVGWTDDCSGGATTTLHVNGPKRCSARFDVAVTTSPRTLLQWDSQPANGLARGRSEVLSLVNSRWSSLVQQDSVQLTVKSVGPRSDSYWTLVFRAPQGEVLQTGRRYANADDFPAPGIAGFAIFGNGIFCSGGEFTIRELSIAAPNTLLRFAADFVLDCGSGANRLLTGSVQYNSLAGTPTATILLEPFSLRFGSIHNFASIMIQPAPQTARLTVGRASVGWTATATQPWIQVAPASGSGSAALTVSANILGAAPSSVFPAGSVIVTLADGSGVSRTIDVSLALYQNGTTTKPFGFVDTPRQNAAGITGAIPITGWTLDDVEVAGVTICRAPVSGEAPAANGSCGGAAQVFIGNAVFIEGARPDVQTAYPTHPRADRAGWGFMLLTNMLPNQGNGTFVFHIYAYDREGQTALLDTRTITCENARAIAPFGAIDTPGQGDTISGTAYLNFAWALTPTPKAIPFDGSTLMVYVDGTSIGNPSYNHYRADVATLFPGLANSIGPVGFKIIDTTTLSNGLHTIVWTATDSAGVTSGIGSRYFRVANGAGSIGVGTVAAAASAAVSDESIASVPLDWSPVVGRRGWEPSASWRNHAVGQSGHAVMRGEEIDRFELALGTLSGETYTGYLRVGDRLESLPIGSRLDAATGAFTWSPGVGFVGSYDVVFVRSANSRAIARREVRFILQPKGSGHVGAQIVIDTPRWQQDVAQPFALGGWAADLDAASGTGIDAVHVWAYPLTGGAPVFLGSAARGSRPDIAAIHGDQFLDSGFGLSAQGLTPGNYDLAVFAWSSVSGGFTPATVVRITAR
jgi:uncharacterized repeat protein (TIGR02543 family)